MCTQIKIPDICIAYTYLKNSQHNKTICILYVKLTTIKWHLIATTFHLVARVTDFLASDKQICRKLFAEAIL